MFTTMGTIYRQDDVISYSVAFQKQTSDPLCSSKNLAVTNLSKPVRKKLLISCFLLNFVVSFVMYHGFLNQHFSIDSFDILQSQNHQMASWHINNGRFVYSAVVYLLDVLNIDIVLNAFLWSLLFMCASAFCCVMLLNSLLEFQDFSLLPLMVLDLGALATYNNVFVAEWYQFVECVPMYIITILSATAAAIQIAKQQHDGKRFRIFFAFALLAISYNTYQIGLPLFFFLVLALTVFHSNLIVTLKDCLRLLIVVLICIAVVLMNLVLTQACLPFIASESSRYDSLSIRNVFENIYLLIKEQPNLWLRANGMIGGPWMLLFVISLAVLAGYTVYTRKMKAVHALLLLILLIGGCSCVFVPVLLGSDFWMPPRTIAFLFAFTFFFSCIIAKSTHKIILIGQLISTSVFLLVSTFYVGIYSGDTLLSNKFDKQYIQELNAQIELYEQETNCDIQYLAFLPDASMEWRWDVAGQYKWDVCNRVISTAWSRLNAINYYTDKGYLACEDSLIPNDIKDYALAHDWNEYIPSEQLFFSDDTCYICLF